VGWVPARQAYWWSVDRDTSYVPSSVRWPIFGLYCDGRMSTPAGFWG